MAKKVIRRKRDPESGAEVTTTRSGDAPDVRQREADQNRRMAEEAFVKAALEQWEASAEADEPQRTRSLVETEFNAGKHWDPKLRREREDAEHVVLEVNRTPQYLNQVANEQRMSRPDIKVRPFGNSKKAVAKIKSGAIKVLTRECDAATVRDEAFYRMLEKGWAYYRVVEEWESERSFRRTVRTKEIGDDFSVYGDPSATLNDRTDADFWFITEDMPQSKAEEKFQGLDVRSLDQFEATGDKIKTWINKDKKVIRVAEYLYMKKTMAPLYALPSENPEDPTDYEGKFEDELTAADRVVLVRNKDGSPFMRMSLRREPHWALISATQVLDGNADKTAGRPLSGKYLGIIPVYGQKRRLEGRTLFCGMIRDAMDPCIASDYWLSAVTEMVALGPKSPWIVAAEAIAGYEVMWDNANIDNMSSLVYNHKDDQGQALPAPFRNFGEPPIQAMTFILRFADDDLKRVMGIYSAALGAPGPETSGLAIQSRQKESDVANYNYIDNLKRSITLEAKVYLSIMKDIYDQEQMMIIAGDDGQDTKVPINREFTKDGKTIKYDFTEGEYTADVDIGPSFETQRRESAATMTEYLKVDPGAAPLVGDLIWRNTDSPDADEFEQRLRSRVDPKLLNDSGGENEASPKMMAQFRALTDQVQQMTTAMHEMQDQLDSEDRKFQHEINLKKMELDSQERRANSADQLKAADILTKADLDEFKAVLGHIEARLVAQEKQLNAGPATAPTAG